MGDRAGAPGVEPGAHGGTDQVEAVRDWLRQRGVDPGDAPGPAREPASPGRGRGADRASASGPGGAVLTEDDVETDGEADTLGTTEVGWKGSSGSDRSGRGRGRGSRRGRGGPGGAPESGDSHRPPSPTDDPDADPVELARRIVLRKLAAQARTRTELERALAKCEVPEEAAATVLDRMDEVGLIDDASFARDWVASRQQRRHLSRTALRRELQTKGVDRDLIDDALADVAPDDEHAAALDLARRRAATMGGLARELAYRRLGGVLARRGFSGSVVAQVLGEVLEGHGD